MYSTVLLIGGGLNFKGADEFLLKRLQAKLPNHYQYLKDQMEVINRPKVCIAQLIVTKPFTKV